VQADICYHKKIYTTATKPYYFPMGIGALTQTINRGQQVHAHSANIDITLGYPAADVSSTQVTLTRYHPKTESAFNM